MNGPSNRPRRRAGVTRAALVALGVLVGAATLAVAQDSTADVAATDDRSPSRDYRIGVEDVLRIVVWDEPQLSLAVNVRPDGKITVPLVNDVLVDGKTPMQIRQVLTERLAEFVNEPSVTVIVERINSFKVYFIGEFGRNGVVTFTRPTRVMQGIASSGGLSEFAKKDRVWLIREADGEERRFRIDYRKLLSGDRQQENLFLQPGDTLMAE